VERKRKSFEERSWKRKQTQKHLTFWRVGSGSIFHKTWGRDVAAEAVKFLWKRKHFEEKSWKRKQTWKQLTLYGAESEANIILVLSHRWVRENIGLRERVPLSLTTPLSRINCNRCLRCQIVKISYCIQIQNGSKQ